MFDGTTVSMPDTPDDQARPQTYKPKPGLGFPISRIGAITSLAYGAIVNLGFRRNAGKVQGNVTFEEPLLRVRGGRKLLRLVQPRVVWRLRSAQRSW